MPRKPIDRPRRTVAELEDELKHRDRRIEELRTEVDELRDLVSRLREHAEDYTGCLERWQEAFDMEMTDTGHWTWGPFWDEHWKTIDDYNALVRDWNRCLPRINGRSQPIGRPLAASDAQCAEVLKLRKAGWSLRGIADETNLGLNTVRTIIGKKNGTDRTTKKHRQRIEPDRAQMIRWKRQRRTGDALPRQVESVIKAGAALIKEAKGLGRS